MGTVYIVHIKFRQETVVTKVIKCVHVEMGYVGLTCLFMWALWKDGVLPTGVFLGNPALSDAFVE